MWEEKLTNLLREAQSDAQFEEYARYNLNCLFAPILPDFPALESKYAYLMKRQRELDRYFYCLLDRIYARTDIRIIGLKGLFLSQKYRRSHTRLYGDIDLLTQSEDSIEIIRCFQDEGFSYYKNSTPFYSKEALVHLLGASYVRLNHSIELFKTIELNGERIHAVVDIHPNLNASKRTRFPMDQLFENAVPIDGLPYYELEPHDYILYLIEHLCYHLSFVNNQTNNLEINLQRIYDIFLILDQNQSAISGEILYERAERYHLLPQFTFFGILFHMIFDDYPFQFPIDMSMAHPSVSQCHWSPVLLAAPTMRAVELVLGDYSRCFPLLNRTLQETAEQAGPIKRSLLWEKALHTSSF